MILISSKAKNLAILDKVKNRILLNYVNSIATFPHYLIIQKIIHYTYWPLYDHKLDRFLIDFFTNYMNDLKSTTGKELNQMILALQDKIDNPHIELIKKALFLCAEFYSKSQVKTDIKQTLLLLNYFTKFSLRHFNLFSRLYADLGRHYLELSGSHKVSILIFLGRRSVQNAEIFQTICNDIVACPQDYYKHHIDILSSLGEANYENEE